MKKPNNQMVLSALGKDRPGLVDQLTRVIYDLDCNICDSRMTVLGGEFAILLLVEGPWNQLARLEGQLPELERNLGLTIISRYTEPPGALEEALPYTVDVVSLDHPGIVNSLASFFSQRGINIIDLHTTSYAAPHTGTPMFAVHMNIGVPAGIRIGELRDEFLDFCDGMNLDAVMEPYKQEF
ncbi:MAG TPA: glycine cleavage system protein R [Thiotrichales bacterium]|nr:glycine cleavage system protein R [Thiotrichales bacterium]